MPKNVMTKAHYEEKYGHSRNVPVSLDLDERSDGLPFILTVGYVCDKNSCGDGARGAELDGEIMPYIRRAVARYLKVRKKR